MPSVILGDFNIGVVVTEAHLKIWEVRVRIREAGETCHTSQTSSTIDYFIVSHPLGELPSQKGRLCAGLATHQPAVLTFVDCHVNSPADSWIPRTKNLPSLSKLVQPTSIKKDTFLGERAQSDSLQQKEHQGVGPLWVPRSRCRQLWLHKHSMGFLAKTSRGRNQEKCCC
jgi:hypothetical protein